MNDAIRPVLSGKKALVVGVANDQSIAYGCARAFRNAGAELAITWLNDKARPHVEPLARDLEAPIAVRSPARCSTDRWRSTTPSTWRPPPSSTSSRRLPERPTS